MFGTWHYIFVSIGVAIGVLSWIIKAIDENR